MQENLPVISIFPDMVILLQHIIAQHNMLWDSIKPYHHSLEAKVAAAVKAEAVAVAVVAAERRELARYPFHRKDWCILGKRKGGLVMQ